MDRLLRRAVLILDGYAAQSFSIEVRAGRALLLNPPFSVTSYFRDANLHDSFTKPLVLPSQQFLG